MSLPEEGGVGGAETDLMAQFAATSSVILLRRLMDACSPYLKRKKMTPRASCNRLNEVHEQCQKFSTAYELFQGRVNSEKE